MPLRPLPNPAAVFRSRILFTTLAPTSVPRKTSISYPLTVKGRTRHVPLWESNYHHPQAEDVPLALVTIDGVLGYSPFAHDHGPLNIAHVHHLATLLCVIFEDPRNKGRAICLYSSPDERLKSAAACLLATYLILVEEQTPWDTYLPLSEFSFIPFRDAAQGESDHGIGIQDVLWGVWKARTYGLIACDEDFDVEAYEWWEQPENGDLNTIGPFIPFASPVDKQYPKRQRAVTTEKSLRNVIEYFKEEEVQLVVRLNEKLYDGAIFEEQGMKHVEMHFPDGSNPPERYVREFISLADQTIARGGKVAVHCKAGLGRTGVLIGAYLIYKYGFAPQEVIAFMRLIRPGMVVGPQQAFMNMNFATWIRWSAVDEMNCLRRTTVFGAESTAVNTIGNDGKEDKGVKGVFKENHAAVLAIKQEIVPFETANSKILATPSRAQERRDAQMIVTRTPGQPRKTPLGKTVVPPDTDMDSTEGVAPLTARLSSKPDPLSPAKPQMRLETIFDPPSATINPQKLFSSPSVQQTPGLKLTRKANEESPVRQTKRRAPATPGRVITRTKSAVAEGGINSGIQLQKTPKTSISRIPMMLGSVKSGRTVDRSKFLGGVEASPSVEDDVFGSPLA